jgi:putative DNA primase/helicase
MEYQLTPDLALDQSQATPLIDRLARTAAGYGGTFPIASVGSEDPETGAKLPPINLHVSNDAHARERLLKAIKSVATERRGRNVYIGISLMKPGLSVHQKGGEEDVAGVLAAVTDWDRKNDPSTRYERLPRGPQAEVETSPGNFQCWYFFDKPYSVAEAKAVLSALARCTKSDHTQSCDHVFRLPGTLNWPSRKKIEAGRSPIPYQAKLTIAPVDWDIGLTLDQLRVAILEKYPDAFDRSAASAASDGGEFDWETPLKPNYRPLSDATVYSKLSVTDGDRSSIAYALIRQCAGRGYKPEQVFNLFERYSTLPVLEHYRDCRSDAVETRLRADIVRAFTKPMESSSQLAAPVFRTYGTHIEAAANEKPRREIKLSGNYLAYAVDEAEAAMIEQGVDLFQRGGAVVRPSVAKIEVRGGTTEGIQLHQVGAAEIREQMTKAAKFLTYRRTEGDWRETNCPEDIARTYSGLAGRWELRPLAGIIQALTLRADGSILDKPGYDEGSGLLLIPPPGVALLEIPSEPTKTQAADALAALKELVVTFPFETDADRSVWLSAVLTAAIRRTLRSAPLHGFNAPVAGAGKGKLADAAAIIAMGREAAAIVQGRTEEETEKRLGALLLSGDQIILIDNCTLPLEGDFLCSMLTQESVRPRILGKSEAPALPANTAIFATGNNLTAKGDMTRRMLRSTIDPRHERPETRQFDSDPVEDARRDRMKYLTAALTILRGYIVAGQPELSIPLGSFEQWNMVRDALLWLGEPDPCATMTDVAADDPEKEKLGAVLHHWSEVVGCRRISTKVLLDVSVAKPGLDAALKAVAPSNRGDSISPDRLGKYLSRNAKRIVAGRRLVQDGKVDGYRQWRLEAVPG